MKTLSRLIKVIDSVTEFVGNIAAWFAAAMVLVTFYIVVTRYVFNTGSIAIQESLIYFNAILVLLTAGYTLKHNAHVRVDIFYSRASERARAFVNLAGSIFLLMPVTLFILISAWDYVAASWAIREDSPEAGGIPYVYLLKTTLPAMCFLIIVQGIAEILRNIQFLFLGGRKAPAEEEKDVHTV